MNLRQPLNIWRVYLDLFANLIGAIAIGGAGVMALVGGAVVNASPAPGAWPLDCRNGEELNATGVLSRIEGLRGVVRSDASCQRETVFSGLTFAERPPDVLEAQVASLEQACDDLVELVRFKRDHQVDGMTIEIVGRSTPTWKEPRNCGTDFSDQQAKRRQAAIVLKDRPELREVVESDIEGLKSAEPDAGDADRSICNRKVELERSRQLLNRCISRVLKTDHKLSGEMQKVSLAASGGAGAEAAAAECLSVGGASLRDCQRTVTLRVRLPPRGLGWAPSPPQGGADG